MRFPSSGVLANSPAASNREVQIREAEAVQDLLALRVRLARGEGIMGSDEVGRGRNAVFLLNNVVLIVVPPAVVSDGGRGGCCCCPDQTHLARKTDMTCRLDRYFCERRRSFLGP